VRPPWNIQVLDGHWKRWPMPPKRGEPNGASPSMLYITKQGIHSRSWYPVTGELVTRTATSDNKHGPLVGGFI
jgi:hypothetical protein